MARTKAYDWDEAVELSGLSEKAFAKAFKDIGGYDPKADDFTEEGLDNGWATNIGKVTQTGIDAILRYVNGDDDEDEVDEDEDIDGDEEELDDKTFLDTMKDYSWKDKDNLVRMIKLGVDKLASFSEDTVEAPEVDYDDDEEEDDDCNKPGKYRGWTITVKGVKVTAKKGKKELKTTSRGNIREMIDEAED